MAYAGLRVKCEIISILNVNQIKFNSSVSIHDVHYNSFIAFKHTI